MAREAQSLLVRIGELRLEQEQRRAETQSAAPLTEAVFTSRLEELNEKVDALQLQLKQARALRDVTEAEWSEACLRHQVRGGG